MFSHVLTFSRSFVSRKKTDKIWRTIWEQQENLRRIRESHPHSRFSHVSRVLARFSRECRAALRNVKKRQRYADKIELLSIKKEISVYIQTKKIYIALNFKKKT